MPSLTIETRQGIRTIGPGHPVFIVAEMSGNHNQDIHRAYEIIDAASEAGADAVKIQTYTPETLTIDCDSEYFQVKGNEAWKGKTLHQLYKQAYTPWDWQPKLKDYGESKGLVLFSTAFDPTSVDFLEGMKVSVYKIASFEVPDIPLLKKVGRTRRPVIISRGMASIEEMQLALATLRENGTQQIAILHCVSSYPAVPSQMNLLTISDIARRFNVVAGLSDHTLGITASLTSVGLGACIIERHFTLARKDGGPDAAFSLEPKELKQLVNSVREAEQAIGKISYDVDPTEAENIAFRKSLFVVSDMKKGDKFTTENVRVIRPGHGLAPKYFEEVLGMAASQEIKRGTPLDWKLIDKNSRSS